MDPGIARSRPYDLGVLLVHGIGEQQKGDTLLQAGDALVSVLRARLAWLQPGGRNAAAPRVALANVALNREEPGEPPQAEIVLEGVERLRSHTRPGAAASRWLLAESFWADAFPPPPYLSVFFWVVSVLPGTLVAHFHRRLRRTIYSILSPDNLGSRFGKYLRLGRDLAALVLAMLVVPPLLCVLILAVLIGFLPVPFADTIARTLQRIIASIIGDSYALLGNALTAGTVVSQVRRDVKWLAARCEYVAIVAHSQGGAIAQMAVREDPLTECQLLLTYGSGLHKLTLVETMRRQGAGLIWIAAGLLLAAQGLIASALAGGSTVAAPFASAAVLSAGALAALAVWLRNAGHVSPDRQRAADRELWEKRFRLDNERVDWTDVFASDDPVPNGPLLDEYAPLSGLNTRETCNLGSPLWDHTSYWLNRDDFVSRLARVLLSRAHVDVNRDADHRLREDVSKSRRRWRVSWRRWSSWAAAFAAGCVAFRLWTNPTAFGTAVYAAIAPVIRSAPFVGEWLAPRDAAAFHSPLGVLSFVLLFVALGWALVGRWNAWNRAEMSAFFERRPFTSLTAPSLIYWAMVAAVVLLGGSTVFGWWPVLVAAVAGSVAMATWLSDALLTTRFWDGVRTRASGGPIAAVRDRWRQMDERALERHVKRGRRSAIFEMGLRGIDASTMPEKDLGRRALERALAMGLPEAGWWLGDHLETRSDWGGARCAYEQGLKLGHSYAAYRLGLLLEVRFADKAGAIKVYEDAAFRMNDRSAAHSLGHVYRSDGKRRLMRRALRRGVQLGDTLSMQWLGEAYRDAARDRRKRSPRSAAILHAAARACYQRALQRGDSEAARQLGELLLDANDVAGAIAAFEDGMRLRDAACARALGEVLLKEGRDEEAERALHLAIEFSKAPDDKGKVRLTRDGVESAWLLGQRVEARGAVEPAMRLYRFATGFSTQPSDGKPVGIAEAAVRLGRLLDERGEREQALPLSSKGSS